MKFETDNERIIRLFKIYKFTRYYYFNVIIDLLNNVGFADANNIYSYLNETELNTYMNYLKISEDEKCWIFFPPEDLSPQSLLYHFHLCRLYKCVKAEIIESFDREKLLNKI